MWKFVNHICQYFPLFASISRYFPVNATGMANMLICRHFANLGIRYKTRLAIDRSLCILTRPVVNTGFNRSLLVDWWSIGQLKKNMVDVKILSISYPILMDSINRLIIFSI